MLRAAILAAFVLASVSPISSAPMDVEAPNIKVPGLVTMTSGVTAFSEIPNPAFLSAANPGSANLIQNPSPVTSHKGFDRLLARQIRVADHNIGTNMSTAHASDLEGLSSSLLKRNARTKKQQGKNSHNAKPTPSSPPPAATPTPAPAQGGGLTQIASQGVRIIGQADQEAGAESHTALADVFAAQDGAETGATNNTATNLSTKTQREVLPDTYFRTPLVKRHNFNVDTDAILPKSPDPSDAQQDAAWENKGLLNFDSNRHPDPDSLPLPSPVTVNTSEATPAVGAANSAAASATAPLDVIPSAQATTSAAKKPVGTHRSRP